MIRVIEFLKVISIRRYWWLKLIWDKKHSFLYETGWIRSFEEKRPVDKDGIALPWLSQSAICFLESRMKKDMSIFEFGCGNSTIWLSKKVKNIYSLEHNRFWYQTIYNILPDNCNLELQMDMEKYPFISNEKSFDLILIDGRERVKCMGQSINRLNEGGVILLDDSNRPKYKACYDIAKNNGFKYIDFWGVGPGSIEWKSSTIFYQDQNCLGI